jgi:hypothetical protein
MAKKPKPVTPLATWDDDKSRHNELVWWTRLDDRYQVEVQRLYEANRGRLCIFDREQDMALIHNEEVTLMYGAVFGPDVDDVNTWQQRVLQVIDVELA